MNIDEFYDKLRKILPYTSQKDSHFRIRLGIVLRQYKEMVSKLDLPRNPLKTEDIEKISRICDKLSDIVKSSMQGMPSRAYSQLHNLLSDKEGNPLINIRKTILTYDKNEYFYRIRLMDSINEATRKDLFHIPLDMRGMIKTQRFSIPGYPCLYLGESIYGCWEEMSRPQMFKCAVSRFRNDQPVNFVDMTIPTKEFLYNPEYLVLLPLVIACSIRVSDDGATYKPEYIVPQLLMEWILKNRTYTDFDGSKKQIHGVAFSSTHLNKDFEFPENCFINYAIPVFSVDYRNRFCRKLCELFSLTLPTTNDIEKLKGGYPSEWEYPDDSEEEKIENNYKSSDFGNLEARLGNETKFPLGKLDCKGNESLVNN